MDRFGIAMALSALLISTPATAFSGKARVVDGDTLKIGSEYVRILGIDAPEKRQTCSNTEGDWPCGIESMMALKTLIGDSEVLCTGNSHDHYGRVIAECSVNGIDIGMYMVLHGWAMAYTRYSTRYVTDEAAARAQKLGIWAGWLVSPEEFRRNR